MAENIDPDDFIDALLPVVGQCARASLIFYGQVADIGKAADKSLTGSKAQDASTAFTVLDAAVQDILLAAVLQHFPFVRCIAEERTPLKKRFAGNTSPYAVILDPIDGTLHFKRGDAPYHIVIGLACDGQMLAAIVARPSEDKIFTAIKGARVLSCASAMVARGACSYPAEPRTNKAFISSKARPYQDLVRPALDPRESPYWCGIGPHGGRRGHTMCAYLTRQVEVYDVGPPSLIAEEAGARCYIGQRRRPTYTQRRKFGHFLAAANDEIAEQLFAILRRARQSQRL